MFDIPQQPGDRIELYCHALRNATVGQCRNRMVSKDGEAWIGCAMTDAVAQIMCDLEDIGLPYYQIMEANDWEEKSFAEVADVLMKEKVDA